MIIKGSEEKDHPFPVYNVHVLREHNQYIHIYKDTQNYFGQAQN